jgi:hypothetical protein
MSLLVQFFAFSLLIVLASSWGFQAHRLTALVAQNFLLPQTETAIEKLVGGPLWAKSARFPQGPIAYPDDFDHTKPGVWSYDLHFAYSNSYAYFDYDCDCTVPCSGTPKSMGYCTEGQMLGDCCVVAGIEKMEDELFLQIVDHQTNASADKGNTADPALKLMMLAHWIGDIHQPLHVDLNDDEGGNEYSVTWFGNKTCYYTPCNLHKIWDTMIVDLRLDDWGPEPPYTSPKDDPREAAFAQYLVARMELMFNVSAQGVPINRTMAGTWATDSVMLASMSYLVPEGFDVALHYYTNALPIIELQIWRAGFRIASALNYIFGGKEKGCADCQWWVPLCQPIANYQMPAKCSVGNETITPSLPGRPTRVAYKKRSPQ